MRSIIIGGDICPINSNWTAFMTGDHISVFGDLLMHFEEAGLVIANLECPLIYESAPIEKLGPVLGVGVDCIRTLSSAGIDVLNLANNHIMDHGPAGLESTLIACAKVGIETVGAGNNLDEARRILIRELDGVRVGILGMAEHEFSIASSHSGGANPLDIVDFVRRLREYKEEYDYLITLIHGGNEYYPYPSPRIRNICRFMVESGANAVIVQHTHCPGCFEEYNGGHIVYGQGNLIFDYPGKDESFYEGFLVRLDIGEDLAAGLDIIPYEQSLGHIGARKMKASEESQFRKTIVNRSVSIMDDDFLKESWLRYCDQKKNTYLSAVLGHGRLLSRLNRNGRLLQYLYSKESLYRVRNLVMCEAHREILETIFEHRLT